MSNTGNEGACFKSTFTKFASSVKNVRTRHTGAHYHKKHWEWGWANMQWSSRHGTLQSCVTGGIATCLCLWLLIIGQLKKHENNSIHCQKQMIQHELFCIRHQPKK